MKTGAGMKTMFEKFNELGLDTSAVSLCKEDREDFFAC